MVRGFEILYLVYIVYVKFVFLQGSLFTLGGLQLPFYVMGSVMLLTLPFSIIFLPKTEHCHAKEAVGTKVLAIVFKVPAVPIICLVVAVSSCAWSFLEPTLVIRMEQVIIFFFFFQLEARVFVLFHSAPFYRTQLKPPLASVVF